MRRLFEYLILFYSYSNFRNLGLTLSWGWGNEHPFRHISLFSFETSCPNKDLNNLNSLVSNSSSQFRKPQIQKLCFFLKRSSFIDVHFGSKQILRRKIILGLKKCLQKSFGRQKFAVCKKYWK